jgi:hypothetical protein
VLRTKAPLLAVFGHRIIQLHIAAKSLNNADKTAHVD